jgi:DNA-binding PadR family transcriptional regulator
MRTLPVIRHKLPHAILLALTNRPMSHKDLYRTMRALGRQNAASQAINRMMDEGLIAVTITESGRAWLRRSGE